jgi:hypothetical protein
MLASIFATQWQTFRFHIASRIEIRSAPIEVVILGPLLHTELGRDIHIMPFGNQHFVRGCLSKMLADGVHLPGHISERRLKLLILGFRRSDSAIHFFAACPVICILTCRTADRFTLVATKSFAGRCAGEWRNKYQKYEGNAKTHLQISTF